MYLAWALATLAVAGYGLATRSWQAMAAGFAFNALETAGTIVWATTKHRLVPPALLGRVSSFDWLISIGLVPVSFAITGPVAGVLGAGPDAGVGRRARRGDHPRRTVPPRHARHRARGRAARRAGGG